MEIWKQDARGGNLLLQQLRRTQDLTYSCYMFLLSSNVDRREEDKTPDGDEKCVRADERKVE